MDIRGEKVGVRGLIGGRLRGARSVLRVTGEDEQNKVRGWRAEGRLTFMIQRKKEIHRILISCWTKKADQL